MTYLTEERPSVAMRARRQLQLRRLRITICVVIASLLVGTGIILWFKKTSDPLAGSQLYVPADTPAAISAAQYQASGNTKSAQAMARLAALPSAEWFTDGTPSTVEARARQFALAAAQSNAVPVGVVYNLPGRDCQASEPTASAEDNYREWILGLYRGFDITSITAAGSTSPLYPSFKAVLIYEPDSVAQTVGGQKCLNAVDSTRRLALEAETIRKLKELSGVYVYLDAGNSGWFSDPLAIVSSLKAAGVGLADGIAVNVSNFQTTAASLVYGNALSKALGGKHFVVDTSRNGAGPYIGSKDEITDPTWCNPPGRLAGDLPTVKTGQAEVDAYLWIKRLGESDGACRPGELPAGQWTPSYALAAIRDFPSS